MTTYATAAELRGAPNITDDADDETLDRLLTAASQAVDNYCNRSEDGFKAVEVATPRLYPGSGKAYQWVDECIEITLVEIKQSATSPEYIALTSGEWFGFCGEPDRPSFNRVPYRGVMTAEWASVQLFTSGTPFSGWRVVDERKRQRQVPTVRITARWGFAEEIPPVVKEATILLASRWFKRGQSFWADVLANSSLGSSPYGESEDPDLARMLRKARMKKPIYS